MEDQLHLSSQNHSSNSHVDDTSEENIIRMFRDLYSPVMGSAQNHDHQSSIFSSNASGLDLQLNPSISGVNRANGYSSYNLNPSVSNPSMGETIDSSSFSLMNNFAVSTQWNSFSPHGSFLAEDINGINGGFSGGGLSMQTILNDARLDLDDPGLLHELGDFQIVMLAKYQKGSQYLKRMLETNGTAMMIFNAVVSSDMVDLMNNEFGRKTFQKLLDSCNHFQIQVVVFRLVTQTDALFWASINKHGVLCVKKLIKTVKRSSLASYITTALAPRIQALMIDQTGFHVIRTCLELLDRRQNYVIFEVAENKCLELATHEQGCITLNSCIDYMTDPYRSRVLNIIIENSVYLSQDPYGNYALQRVLEIHNPVVNSIICRTLQGSYVRLSMQKSGSHVVETCAKTGGIVYVVNDLVGSDKLVQVAKNQFGNYVIQTALKATKGSYRDLYQSLETALQPHLADLRYHSNGRNVYNLIKDEKV